MLSYSPAYNLNNSGFNPIAIFIRSPGLEKSAMSPMDRRDQPDECVALQCRSEEHGVWDEWIILRGDNGRGHGYGVQHMAGARTVVRSEERRVGEAGGERGWRDRWKEQ